MRKSNKNRQAKKDQLDQLELREKASTLNEQKCREEREVARIRSGLFWFNRALLPAKADPSVAHIDHSSTLAERIRKPRIVTSWTSTLTVLYTDNLLHSIDCSLSVAIPGP